ncbi:MAG: O-phosphoseryl-tRNA(Sec) selenium transferase [Candidatus Lokiarchaeota archaeon]|nr:O-phosphoseryl-tRNA(Sec) selenium transferase [Candidatus Harpocratesius repetitus]
MWDKKFLQLFSHLGVPDHMLKRSFTGFSAHWNKIKELLNHRVLPENGWDDELIRHLLLLLNYLDSDKDPFAIRIGEREGRVSTPLLRELSGDFCHGVGRSGNLTAAQPKAAGASLMQNLTNKLVLSLIQDVGMSNAKSALTVPMGTGMSIGLALKGCLDYYNISIHQKPFVLMTQIDHKSPKKGIEFIGAKVLTISGKFGKNHWAHEGVYVGQDDIERLFSSQPDKIAAIVSNCAFFAPRVPDNLKSIAKFAQKHNLIHIINDAYGIQSPRLVSLIRSAIDAGKVDAVIQSTDKCFLTPVGGAVIISPNASIIQSISNSYAGRASAAPILHLLVSLLSMGKNGYKKRIASRQKARELLESQMQELAGKYNERIFQCSNPVSCAMTLENLSIEKISQLGGYLYNLRVTGPRVINVHKNEFGSCTTKDQLPISYLVMNAAIGVEEIHIKEAINRLQKAFHQLCK